MRIISIKQPWASLIVTGARNIETGKVDFKDIENRTWPTKYRGPLLIHASRRPDTVSQDEIARRFGVRLGSDAPVGGVVGIADVIDCVPEHPSKWHVAGHYGFVLANARTLPFKPWRGTLSIRQAAAELLEHYRLI